MTDDQLKDSLAAIQGEKAYRKRRGESREQYAARATSIIHRGWAFLGLSRAWYEGEKERILALV